ncbi:MAG: insecticidal toxin protein, partial [Deltaproteobacteria bacterium]|nr:insecticidal toxin protein [Deltaproteobacteria bacterium]
LALLKLRTTGRCTVRLPEELFDMDGPGHYFRRIKTVALSIPCVTGPYASVNCTLTMLKSSIRKTQVLRDGGIYAREDAEDDRFNDYFGSLQSIVTSSAQNDSGLFETNLHDERYLPFENSGVISEWHLELPADVRQFDYDTISDVILHLRYTAREGGGLLKNGAVANLKTRIEEAQAAGSVRLFSVRHEFPTEWAKFTSIENVSTDNPAEFTLKLKTEHYPFWSKDSLETVKQVKLFAKTTDSIEVSDKVDANGKLDEAGKIALEGLLGELRTGKLAKTENFSPTGPFTLFFDNNSMEDLWLALTWGK